MDREEKALAGVFSTRAAGALLHSRLLMCMPWGISVPELSTCAIFLGSVNIGALKHTWHITGTKTFHTYDRSSIPT